MKGKIMPRVISAILAGSILGCSSPLGKYEGARYGDNLQRRLNPNYVEKTRTFEVEKIDTKRQLYSFEINPLTGKPMRNEVPGKGRVVGRAIIYTVERPSSSRWQKETLEYINNVEDKIEETIFEFGKFSINIRLGKNSRAGINFRIPIPPR
jgi:hypothetical protein